MKLRTIFGLACGPLVVLTGLGIASGALAADAAPAAPAAPAACVPIVTNAATVFPVPTLPKPAYLVPMIDPSFGTTVTRIAGNQGSSTAPVSGSFGSDVRHHYSTDQPWSADGSLYAIQNSGSPSQLYLDGETFVPRYGRCSNYSSGDDWWHPTTAFPHVRISINGNKLSWFNVATCTKLREWTLPISPIGGVTEGMSWDGRYAAVTNGTEGNSGKTVVVVEMDPLPGRVGPAQDVFAGCGSACTSIDWVGVSPSGKYVVVSYSGDFERVFNINPDLTLTPRQISTPKFPGCASSTQGGFVYDVGHGNMAPNPFDNNEDVLVGQEHCGNRNKSSVLDSQGKRLGGVIMVRLKDGQITSLTDPANEADPRHVSVVAYDNPGWAYVSYHHDDYAGDRFLGEIIAVSFDGSKSTKRLAHSHTDYGSYRSEAHAVPSRDGKRVAFASSWSTDCSSCGSTGNPQNYVIDTRTMCGSTDTTPPVVTSVASASITANSASITFSTNEPGDSYVEYGLTTAYGSIASNATLVTAHAVPLSNLVAATIYHYRVRSTDGSGNASSFSADRTFTTVGGTPPAAPANLVRTDTGAESQARSFPHLHRIDFCLATILNLRGRVRLRRTQSLAEGHERRTTDCDGWVRMNTYALVKRPFDIAVAGFALLVTWPLILLGAIAVKIGSPGPVWYRAQRAGMGGRPFEMLKLRTMRVGQDATDRRVTAPDDARVTPEGKLLRKCKIDELPQLWNVVRGDMSIVGPRPEDWEIVQRHFTQEQRRVFEVRPGIASPVDVEWYPDFTYHDPLPAGVSMQEHYVQRHLPLQTSEALRYIGRRSLLVDLEVIGRLIYCVLVYTWRPPKKRPLPAGF